VFLNRNRKTGTLSFKTPVFIKKMYINGGDVVFSSSTLEDDRLGEKLLKADKITFEQYDKSVEVLKSSRNKRQGAILVELGYITPKDLYWGVKYQVKEIIHSMFLVEDAAYEFIEGDLPTKEVITIKMSMGNLIYEGVRKIENWTRIRKEMPNTNTVLKLSNDPISLFQGIELNSQDKKILSLIDGRKNIKEVIENSWLGSFEALKILYVLWSIGIVEEAPAHAPAVGRTKAETKEAQVSLNDILQPLSEEEETLLGRIESIYARLDTMSMQELLEINGKGETDLKKNYYRLAKEFHPDRSFTIADESVKVKLTAIFDAITIAYDTLGNISVAKKSPGPVAAPHRAAPATAPHRAAPATAPHKAAPATAPHKAAPATAPHKAAPAAAPHKGMPEGLKGEELFKKGIDEFKKKNFKEAVENFGMATKIIPGNAVYWSYLSLSLAKIPGKIDGAEKALLEATRLEPLNPDYQANLGLIYMRAGLKKKARTAFEKALKIDPKNEKARKGIQQTGG
jgi:tetratricopeptide (TPR) repeat protein